MLHEIVERVRADLPGLWDRRAEIRAEAARTAPARDFGAALRAGGLSVIAEVKRRSPSRGVLASNLDPVAQARRYEEGGASAVSVLTEQHFFAGSPADLRAVRSAVDVPILRKDFIVDPLQVWESKAMGADAILLIVAALSDHELVALHAEAGAAGLAALVEVHTRDDVTQARSAGATIIGVNNRDLATFDVSLATAESLAPFLEGVDVRVAESGIRSLDDAKRMRQSGYDAVLVGEALVTAPDPAAAIARLRGRPEASMTLSSDGREVGP